MKKDFLEIRGYSQEKLKEELIKEKDSMMRLRFLKATGETKGYEAKRMRRKIARIKTVFSQKRREGL
jgi:ribosomal protein L29